MAHFAKVEDGAVTQVVVVDNSHEANGQEFLNSLGLEGTWIQTSYNSNFRGKFAGIGDLYNQSKDRFEPAQPYASWIWNEEKYCYEAPVAYPEDTEEGSANAYSWNEDTVSWDPVA